ncbi:craniofacial development protein 2-like [Anneissia japonica]|uniref:craniofacial development protein 2-like n=1 Tax=Anneissia japonica TaxID=1529436 RepID=UPI001425B549|nr:craniofacial development protein 2-like [Anneissia japonica]
MVTWNVRTLLDRSASDRPERRTALVDRELYRYSVDIAALQETRLKEQGQIKEQNYTFFLSGHQKNGPSQAGVALAISNKLLRNLPSQPKPISPRLIQLRLDLDMRRSATVLSAYAPTMTNNYETKEQFYSQLAETIRSVQKSDKILILGDFNARVGGDYVTWDRVVGKFGRGKTNSNGEMLLSLCTEFDLAVTNAYFNNPDGWYHSWCHPRSKHWHLLDYVLTRRADIKDVCSTRALRGADCHTDYRMIRTKLKLTVDPPRRKTAPKPTKHLNVAALRDPEVARKLAIGMDASLNCEQPENTSPEFLWHDFKSKVYDTASKVLSHPERRNADWFNVNDAEIRKYFFKPKGRCSTRLYIKDARGL